MNLKTIRTTCADMLGKENLENMAEYLIKWDCVTFWHILSGSFLVDSNLSCKMLTPSNSRPSEALNSETILMVTYFVCLSGLRMIFLSELGEPFTGLLSNDALLVAAGAPAAAAVLSAILFWR